MSGKNYIVHVIDSLNAGGSERMAVEIANATDKNKYRPIVCVTRGGMQLEQLLGKHVERVCLERRAKLSLSGLNRFIKLVKYKQKILLHVHGRSSLLFVISAIVLGRVKPPLIFHDHYGMIEKNTKVPLWLRVLGNFFIDKYVGVGRCFIDFAVSAGFQLEKIEVIENAINLESYARYSRGRRARLGGNLAGLFIGNLRPQKDLLTLIKAVAEMKNRSRLCLCVIGAISDKVYYNACMQAISESKLEGVFRFVGAQTDVIQLFESVDFAVISSCSESGPIALIEYMAAGLPFVSTKTGYVAQLAFQQGLPGFVPVGDIRALSRALDDLFSLSPEALLERGKKGKPVAAIFFDITKKISQWQALYDELLAQNKRIR